MAKITVTIPDEVQRAIEEAARQAGKSVSAWVAEAASAAAVRAAASRFNAALAASPADAAEYREALAFAHQAGRRAMRAVAAREEGAPA